MRGMMMDYQLTLGVLLERAARLFPQKEIVSRTATGLHRQTYAELRRRCARLASAWASSSWRTCPAVRSAT